MRLLARDGQFWVGNRLGEVVRTRWGKAGAVREGTHRFESADAAARELERLVGQLEALGFVREIPPEVLAALQDDPRDTRSPAVLGDALAERGDVRGELVSLALARRPEDCAAFLARHARRLWADALGDLEGEYLEVTWHGGFVECATLDEFANVRGPSVRRLMERLLDAPAAALVRSLTVKPADSDADFAAALDLLQALPHPEVLSVLRLDSELFPSMATAAPPRVPLQLFPALRELHLRDSFEPGDFRLPRLRLFAWTGASTTRGLAPLAAHPAIDTMMFGVKPGGTVDGTLDEVLRSLPALKRLSLWIPLTEAALEALVRLPVWKQLEGLDLRFATVEDSRWLTRFLERKPGVFDHLRELAPPLAPGSDEPLARFRGLGNLVAADAFPSWLQRW